MANYNRTIEQVKEYLLAKETRTEVEEGLLKMINEDLERFPVLRIHRDNIKQEGFITEGVTDEMMLDLADKMEDALCNTGCWDSLKVILSEHDEFHHEDDIVCPACGGFSAYFYDHDMYFMCDTCDHIWKQLKGIRIHKKLTEKLLKEKLIPLFKELLPDCSHYEQNKSVNYPCYDIYRANCRNNCATVYQENLWTTAVLTSLTVSKTLEELSDEAG